MRPPSGRAFDKPGLEAANRRRDKNIDVLNRRTQKPVKIPPPVAGDANQVVQVEQMEYLAQSGTVFTHDQDTALPYSEIRWDPGTDPSGRIDFADWCWIDETRPWRIRLAEGLYQAGMVLELGWGAQADGPERIEITFNGGWNSVTASRPTYSGRQAIAYQTWGIRVLHNPGVFYSSGTDFLQPEADFGGNPCPPTTIGACAITITRFK